MRTLMIMLILGLAGLGFSIMYSGATTASPMACLKTCCASACGNGQWDSDGGFCHGPQANTTVCLSCQSDCRAGVQPHIAGEQTTTVSARTANNSTSTQNATPSGANATGSTQVGQTTSGQSAAASASSQGFNLEGLWIVVAAILLIIVVAILILGFKH